MNHSVRPCSAKRLFSALASHLTESGRFATGSCLKSTRFLPFPSHWFTNVKSRAFLYLSERPRKGRGPVFHHRLVELLRHNAYKPAKRYHAEMTADKYQPKNQRPLDEMVRGIEMDVGAIKKLAAGIYDRVEELGESTSAIYDAVVKADRHDYDPLSDESFLDDMEE